MASSHTTALGRAAGSVSDREEEVVMELWDVRVCDMRDVRDACDM